MDSKNARCRSAAELMLSVEADAFFDSVDATAASGSGAGTGSHFTSDRLPGLRAGSTPELTKGIHLQMEPYAILWLQIGG